MGTPGDGDSVLGFCAGSIAAGSFESFGSFGSFGLGGEDSPRVGEREGGRVSPLRGCELFAC